MKKAVSLALVLLLCLGLFAGCGKNEEGGKKDGEWKPVTVTDDLGREVTIDEEPKAVAAIMGSFADTWVLAGGTLKAAVHDAWEDFNLDMPEDAVDLGKYNAINVEQLFAAEVDLVIASANTKKQVDIKDTLENAGIKVLYLSVNNFEDYLRTLKICTDITGRADLYEKNGTDVAKQVEAAKKTAAEKAAAKGSPKILYVRAAASVIKAKGSDDTVLGIMLKDIGCTNIADSTSLLDDLSLEVIIQEDPEMIFITQQGSDREGTEKVLHETLTGNPAWAGLKAVKEDKVFYMDKNLYQLKPNARWGEAYEKLTEIVYGK